MFHVGLSNILGLLAPLLEVLRTAFPDTSMVLVILLLEYFYANESQNHWRFRTVDCTKYDTLIMKKDQLECH